MGPGKFKIPLVYLAVITYFITSNIPSLFYIKTRGYGGKPIGIVFLNETDKKQLEVQSGLTIQKKILKKPQLNRKSFLHQNMHLVIIFVKLDKPVFFMHGGVFQ